MGQKTKKVQVGSEQIEVAADKPIQEAVQELADKAGYNTFWVFMQNQQKERQEVREGDVKGKTLEDIEEGVQLVIEKYDEGGLTSLVR